MELLASATMIAILNRLFMREPLAFEDSPEIGLPRIVGHSQERSSGHRIADLKRVWFLCSPNANVSGVSPHRRLIAHRLVHRLLDSIYDLPDASESRPSR